MQIGTGWQHAGSNSFQSHVNDSTCCKRDSMARSNGGQVDDRHHDGRKHSVSVSGHNDALGILLRIRSA